MSSTLPTPAARPMNPVTRVLGEIDPTQIAAWRQAPPRDGRFAQWPQWMPAHAQDALTAAGVSAPYVHQRDGLDAVWAGQNVCVATGTASGKSLIYSAPAVLAAGGHAPPWWQAPTGSRRTPSTLYIAPTKALAADQARALDALHERLNPRTPSPVAVCDGDASDQARAYARAHASIIVTNPDWVSAHLLPGHRRWTHFLRHIAWVVVDEAHIYRGVFGAHVSYVLRRLARVMRACGANPRFITATATCGNPGEHARVLTAQPARVIEHDASPRPATDVVLMRPGVDHRAGHPLPAPSAARHLVARFVEADVRSLVFLSSRRGVENFTSQLQADVHGLGLDRAVVAYRGGYLPEERRGLEAGITSGAIHTVACTSALELGVDTSGLDASVVVGWPGTRAALRQRFGRAGRRGAPAAGVFVGRDDPLDEYLLDHPDEVLDTATENVVVNTANVHVGAPHVAAAAAEAPLGLQPADEPELRDALGDELYEACVDFLRDQGVLRRREAGWFWQGAGSAASGISLRGSNRAVTLLAEGTGQVLGTVDRSTAPATVHPGAVYVHAGVSYVVTELRLDDHVAQCSRRVVPFTTYATSDTSVELRESWEQVPFGPVTMHRGMVEVTTVVTGYTQRDSRGRTLGTHRLDMPPGRLLTHGVWWDICDAVMHSAGLDPDQWPGALHAAEHTLIALLPLVATCDRWDLGGVSIAGHPETGRPLIVVHDAMAGGSGLSHTGFERAESWWRATTTRIAECRCAGGCPSCVQSPKCGNGNEPLSKAGALALMRTIGKR